jgi:predicted GIY-YIG superfamily endonuclease
VSNSQTHALYRFYDATGTLLYVGITADPGARWRSHARGKPWWHEVRGVSLETYPDRASVLAAETRAIAVENPRHNKQRPQLFTKRAQAPTAHPPRQLVWLCTRCQEPIADGLGYIHVNMRSVFEIEAYWAAAEKRQLEGGSVFVDISDLRDWPDDAPWMAHHADCDPYPEAGDYWFDVKRARTHAQLLNWTAHLMGKDWLKFTDWDDLIQRQAAVDA